VEPRTVTAWDLVAHYGTGGMFEARRPGSRVVWTDARQVRGEPKHGDDVVVVGRLEATADGLRVFEQRVRHDAPFVLLSACDDGRSVKESSPAPLTD
jgi:hypothetical protein